MPELPAFESELGDPGPGPSFSSPPPAAPVVRAPAPVVEPFALPEPAAIDDTPVVPNFGPPADDNLGIALPDPPTPRLITEANPTGQIPTRDRGFLESFAGGWRSSTLAGATREGVELAAVQWEKSDERRRLVDATMSEDRVEADAAKRALARKDRDYGYQKTAGGGLDAIYAQVAYDNSDPYLSPGHIGGAIGSALASPEAVLGFGATIARKFPALAGKELLPTMGRTAADAALSNTLTDPVVQAARMGTGGQDEYSVAQTLAAPVVGTVAGGALGAGAKGVGVVADGMKNRAAALAPSIETRPPGAVEAAAPIDAEPVSVHAGEPARVPEAADTPAIVAPRILDPEGDPDAAARLKQWRDENPLTDFDKTYAVAADRQAELEIAARAIEQATGATFSPPPIKEDGTLGFKLRETAESKLKRKPEYRGAQDMTDIVRGAFIIERPEQLGGIADMLRQKYDVIDEGWSETPVGYVDRKFLVRFPDGLIGEIQILEKSLKEAKAKGHEIYKEWRDLDPKDPRRDELSAKQISLYSDAVSALSGDWKAALGKGGKSGNLEAKASGETTLAELPTSAPETSVQAPRTNAQASPLDQNAGSPSQMQGLSAEAIPANISAAPEAGKVPKMAPHKVSTAAGRTIDVTPMVVEARSIRSSQDEGYDAALQPRDRDRAASQAQIRDIATNLIPERLGFSAEADRGAPIVGPDGNVESGNGRVLAIRRAYEQDGESAAKYRAWLKEQGVDVDAYEQPILVRQRTTELSPEDRQAFTVEANQAATLAMSAPERAMADARMISTDMLSLIRHPDDLGAIGNRDFMRAFVSKLPQTEQGALVNAEGGLSAEGLARVRNAVLARAYGDSTVLGRVAEATSDDIKSISNALVSAAPDWAKLRADVDAGIVRADMDLTPELLEAVTRTADIRGKGMKLDAFLAQQDAFDRLSAPVETWMRAFYNSTGRKAAGGPLIAERLKAFATEARKVSAEEGLDLGLPPVSARDVQALAVNRGTDGGTADTGAQDVLFRRSAGDGPRSGKGRAQAEGQAAGAGGEGSSGAGLARGQDGPSGTDGLGDSLARRTTAPGSVLPNQATAGRPNVDQGTTVPDVRVQRLEDIGKALVDAFESIGRQGRVTPGAKGVYKITPGVLRIKTLSDIDTLAHEIGHKFHLADAKGKASAVVTANAAELQQFGAGHGAKGNAEAFANLFHAYVMNRAFAERNYPGATAALDNLIKAEFPEYGKAIENARASLDALHRAPSEEVVAADQISKPPPNFITNFKEALQRDIDPQGRTIYSAADALYTSTIDSKHPIYRAVQDLVGIAKDNGKNVDLKPVDDAYILSRRLSGAHSRADTMLKHGVIPAGGTSPQGASLASAIESALGKKWDDKQFAQFGHYLTSRRMLVEYARFHKGELLRPPGKLSEAEYRNTVAALEARYPGFKDGANQVYAFQRAHLKRLFDKGMVTREFYEAANARPDYVPLMRDMSDFSKEANLPAMGGGSNLLYSIAKKFKGSDRSVINPLESIFKRVHDLEYAIQMNDTIGALARLSEEAGPGSGYIAEPIPSNQIRAQKVDVVEALRSAGKHANMDDADLTQMILQVEDQLGDSSWTTLFRQEPIEAGKEPIVYHWVNGERRALRLGDGKMGQELYHALTAMSDMEKNMFVSVLQIAQMALRTGVTRSLDFMLVNIIRDQFTSALTGGKGYVPFVSAARGLADAIKETPLAVEAAGQGVLAGGAMVHSIDKSQFGKDVTSLVKGNLLSQIGRAFELSEAGTRVGLYRSYLADAKARGWDDENAALWAGYRADDYIDFRKHGSSMGAVRRIIPFLNAHLQGSDKELRSIGVLPVLEAKRAKGEKLSTTEQAQLSDARAALVKLTSMGVILGAGLALYNQDNERWTNAPKWLRNQNFMFSAGGHDFTVPKGFGVVQTVVNAFERAAEYAARKDPKIAEDWLEGAAHAFYPPTTNPALGAISDWRSNYNSFRDRPIVPYYMQGWDPSEQYSTFTSSLSRQIAKAGDKIGMEISPMKLDYAFQQLGGGMARDAMFGWDVLMGSDRPEKQIYDYPVLRRFVKNFDRGSQAQDAFHQLVGEKTGKYENAEKAYRGKISAGERQDAADYLRNLKEDERAWTVLHTGGFDTNVKRLHPMQNAKERVAIMNGMVRQLATNNVIKEEDLDRRDITRTRRDATPIALDARQRAQAIEHFLEYQVATTRNAMVAVGAKGTTGLKDMDVSQFEDRLKAVSPDLAKEFNDRLEKKKLATPQESAAAWPEMKRRLLIDGENADLDNLVPSHVTSRARRRASR